MRRFKAANPPVPYDGGLFFAGKSFKQYRFDAGQRLETVPGSLDRIARDALAIKVVLRVAATFATAFDDLQTCPTRDGWKMCCCQFMSSIADHIPRMFGPYSMKLMLDGVLALQPQLNRVISWLPMHASAYHSQLPLYYTLTRGDDDLWLAGCHFHRQMKHIFPKLNLLAALAMLCWDNVGLSHDCPITRTVIQACNPCLSLK